jgi:hypothetical protein
VLRINHEQGNEQNIKSLRYSAFPRLNNRHVLLLPIYRKYLNREAAVWQKLKHQNVLEFLGLASDLGRFPECPAFIAPYCDQGTVKDYLKSHPGMEIRIAMVRCRENHTFIIPDSTIHRCKVSRMVSSTYMKLMSCMEISNQFVSSLEFSPVNFSFFLPIRQMC